jgi:hypothetical protein
MLHGHAKRYIDYSFAYFFTAAGKKSRKHSPIPSALHFIFNVISFLRTQAQCFWDIKMFGFVQKY